MQDDYFTLSQATRLLGKKPHLITYTFTSGHVPEPELRLENNRVFGEDDLQRLARHFGIPRPRICPVGPDRESQAGLALRPNAMVLAGPFSVEQAGSNCHEDRDGNGDVF